MKITLKTEDRKTADQISSDLIKILNLNIKNSLYFIFYEQNKTVQELILEETDRLIGLPKYKEATYEEIQQLAEVNTCKYIRLQKFLTDKFFKLINLIEAYSVKSIPQKQCKLKIAKIVALIHKKVLKIKKIKYKNTL